eukprot:gene11597-8265_t
MENLTLDNEVQLILDGIPEIQFGDDAVTDDLVDHLLQLGGKPPSQLQLPTAQLNHSEVLNTLPKVTHLRISLRNLSVFSARYGVRKEGSYLAIHTPHFYEISLGNNPYHVNAPDLGDHLPSNEGKKPQNTSPLITRRGHDHRLPLKELEALDEPKPVILRKEDKKDSIKKFFLGDCALDYVVCVPLLVTDRLLQEWMRNENTIEVALYGTIPPPGTQQQRGGVAVGPSCFARAKINPINLLTCPELDAMINVDLVADKATLSDVTARMQLLLAGSRVKPLSDRMGVLSVRLTLLSAETTATAANGNGNGNGNGAATANAADGGGLDDRSFHLPTRTVPHQITLPTAIPTQPMFTAPEDAALQYAPHQAPSTQAMTQLLTQTPAEDLRNALDRQPKPLPPREVFLGLAVFGLVGDVVQTLRHLVRQHPQPHPDDSLCVRFKVSATRSDTLRIPLAHGRLDTQQPNALLLPLGKLVAMTERLTQPPCLELWLELVVVVRVDGTGAGDDRGGEASTVTQRHLLAWTARQRPVLFHQPSTLTLVDPTTLQPAGRCFAVFYQHENAHFVEDKLQRQLDTFAFPPPPPTPTPTPAPPSERPTAAAAAAAGASGSQPTTLSPSPNRPPAQMIAAAAPRDAATATAAADDDAVDVSWRDGHEDGDSDADGAPRSRAASNLSDDSLGSSSRDTSQQLRPPPPPLSSHRDDDAAVVIAAAAAPLPPPPPPLPLPLPLQPTAAAAVPAPGAGAGGGDTFVVDVSAHGICSVFGTHVPSTAAPASPLTMGCFVCYALPALHPPPSAATAAGAPPSSSSSVGSRVVQFPSDGRLRAEQALYSLWWDADCAILNGRNRHRFTLPAALRPPGAATAATAATAAAADAADETTATLALARALGVDVHRGWEFHVVGSDVDGNWPRDAVGVAQGSLSLATLWRCLSHATRHEELVTVALTPLTPRGAGASDGDDEDAAAARTAAMAPVELRLRLSWRREPHGAASAAALAALPSSLPSRPPPPLPLQSPVAAAKAALAPLPLPRAVPPTWRETFALPAYRVTVRAFHHLHRRGPPPPTPPPTAATAATAGALLYTLQHAGDLVATSAAVHRYDAATAATASAVASGGSGVLEALAYPETLRVVSAPFAGPATLPRQLQQQRTTSDRVDVGQTHDVVTPVRRSTLRHRRPPATATATATGDGDGDVHATFVRTFTTLGALTLSLVVGQVAVRVEPLRVDTADDDDGAGDGDGDAAAPATSEASEASEEAAEAAAEDEEALLDLTTMEKDALQLALAQLDATKERLLAAFGGPAQPPQPPQPSSVAASPSSAASSERYSADFESPTTSDADHSDDGDGGVAPWPATEPPTVDLSGHRATVAALRRDDGDGREASVASVASVASAVVERRLPFDSRSGVSEPST